ncbi:MAG TPA: S8 family peptidase [Pyrinomonadaceae bacterium]|nr:S8 family peptidase [Pyrinomonadaceae bacterium]
MSRNKYILYIASVLVIVLIVAFASQVRKLQKQLPASVRIIPSESKSRKDVAQAGIEENLTGTRAEILVKFRSGISVGDINQITSRFNDQLQDEIEAVPGLTAIDDRDDAAGGEVADQYRLLPEVEYAEPNYEIAIDQNEKNGKLKRAEELRQAEQWAFTHIGVPEAWATTKGSSGIVVGVLDSGVEYTHIDLVNNIWSRPPEMMPYHDQELGTIDDVHGYNAVANDGDPSDENGHGTAAAGIVGAHCGNGPRICGVSPQVAIMPLKFINAGGFGYVGDAVEAVNYAINRRRAGVNLRVINVSWDLAEPSRALADVIRAGYQVGILFVVSSGSTGTNNDRSPRHPASYDIGNIISVAATNRSDALAQFSNYGVKSVHIAAPGEDLLTTALGNEYQLRSDTALAAAIVSGVAALALSAHPDASLDQLRSLLLESVDMLPALRGKVSTGGRINAIKAVASTQIRNRKQ